MARYSKSLQRVIGLLVLGALLLINTSSVQAQDSGPCFVHPGGYADPNLGYYWNYGGFKGMTGLHEAQDFNNKGVPFMAVAVYSGTIVRYERNNPGSGGVLEFTLDSPYENYKVQYVHMDSSNPIFMSLSKGMHITQGQELGEANGSGTLSDGVHLHLKVWKDGQTINPMLFIGTDCTQLATEPLPIKEAPTTETAVKSVTKVAIPGVGILAIVAIIAMGVGFVRKPEKNVKKLLWLLSTVQDWRQRRKLLRELRKAQEKHGLIRVGLPGVLAIALIFSGFQLKTEGKEISDCSFIPVLTDHVDGKWGFGEKSDFQDYHTGVDKMGTLNEPILASASGKVVWASWWPGDPKWEQLNIGHGNTVVVETSCNGVKWYAFYANLNQINVKVGQSINQGEILGLMGQTGAAKDVHLHFAISQKGPTEEHSFADWVNPVDFVRAHSGQSTSVDLWTWIKPSLLGISGWSLIVLAVLVILFFGESRGLFALLRTSIVPGFFFAALVLFGQLAPILSVTKFNWSNLAKIEWQKVTMPEVAAAPLALPAPEFMAGASVEPGMQDIPAAFAEQVRLLGPQVQKIAMEENVPASTIFTLWLKESGGRRTNPANGEGLCGFYSRVQGGRDYFPPGPIDEAEVLRQLRECAKEFHVHNRTGTPVTYQTSDFDVLGPIYMAYNGNIDCHGSPFASWRDHPYVMNGYDQAHKGMIARDGQGGCVPLSIIGAVPADLRIRSLLGGN